MSGTVESDKVVILDGSKSLRSSRHDPRVTTWRLPRLDIGARRFDPLCAVTGGPRRQIDMIEPR